MSVRIKVRINGAATGATLKVKPGFTTKEQLLTDGLKKLGVDKNDVDMHRAILYVESGDKVQLVPQPLG